MTTLPIWDSVLLDRLARSAAALVAAALVAAALTSAALTSAGMPAAWTSVTAPVIVVMCQLRGHQSISWSALW